MSTEPRPRDFIAPRADARRENRQWAAIDRELGPERSLWQRLRDRFRGDVVPGAPLYTRPAFGAALALAVVALVVVGATSALRSGRGPAHELASTSTEAASMRLADGSEILVERGAKVSTPTNEPMHVVAVLEEGAAHFEVVPNRARSFTVVADGVEVRVVGTAFRVARDPATSRTTVTVDHGIVEVRAASLHGEVKRLGAGESWSSDPSDHGATPPSDPRPSDDPSAGAVDSASAVDSAVVPSGDPPAAASGDDATKDDATKDDATKDDATKDDATKDGPARALFEAANRARRAGDLSRAAALYRDFLRKHPDDPRAQVAALELARLEMEKGGDPSAAERALETASSATPGSSVHEDALAHLVDVYDKKGDREACKKAKAQYLGTYPQGVHASQVRSRCASP